ncbi:MAG: hypothetical protein IJT59_03545 [Desulfovibrionaceae bacterium]|nr:hypothetical protein [Desulfovibrionaceae bacterium]
MQSIDKYISALYQATGWLGLQKSVAPKVWSIDLEDGLKPTFFTLGDAYIIMRGVVLTLPSALPEREAVIGRAAKMQVAIRRERPSILALENAGESMAQGLNLDQDVLICFRRVSSNIETAAFVNEVQDWLNDYGWWMQTLNQEEGQSDVSNLFHTAMIAGLKI